VHSDCNAVHIEIKNKYHSLTPALFLLCSCVHVCARAHAHTHTLTQSNQKTQILDFW
jgi:hypothetical protein